MHGLILIIMIDPHHAELHNNIITILYSLWSAAGARANLVVRRIHFAFHFGSVSLSLPIVKIESLSMSVRSTKDAIANEIAGTRGQGVMIVTSCILRDDRLISRSCLGFVCSYC